MTSAKKILCLIGFTGDICNELNGYEQRQSALKL